MNFPSAIARSGGDFEKWERNTHIKFENNVLLVSSYGKRKLYR
jgi:hypothetical protein